MHSNFQASIAFLVSSSIALIFTYALEYFFNMLPCKLCVYERMIYYTGGLLALAHMIKNKKSLTYAMFFNYFIGVMVSLYHIGLELHLLHDILGCTEQTSADISIEEIKNNLLDLNYSPSCDRPYYILGVSLATWNLIYLIAALFLSSKIYCKRKKKS